MKKDKVKYGNKSNKKDITNMLGSNNVEKPADVSKRHTTLGEKLIKPAIFVYAVHGSHVVGKAKRLQKKYEDVMSQPDRPNPVMQDHASVLDNIKTLELQQLQKKLTKAKAKAERHASHGAALYNFTKTLQNFGRAGQLNNIAGDPGGRVEGIKDTDVPSSAISSQDRMACDIITPDKLDNVELGMDL